VSLDELLPAEHICGVIDGLVTRLDFAGLGFGKAVATATNNPPCDPADLLTLHIKSYLLQLHSSRWLEAEYRRSVEVMRLFARLALDHKTIAEFRRTQGEARRASCASFVRLVREAGVVRGESGCH